MLFIILMCISCFMFFTNEILLAVYVICILDYRNYIRQKGNLNGFLIRVQKWITKQQRQLTTSTTHFAQELLVNVRCSGGSRSFAKEMRVWKMRSTVAGHWKLTMTNWEPLSKLILLQVAQEPIVNHSMVVCHLKLIGKVKKFNKCEPHGAAAAKSLQLCPSLCDPIDGSPPGSPVPGILQARTLEWVAFPSPMRDSEIAQSCLTISDPVDCSLPGSSVHGIFQARVLELGGASWADRRSKIPPFSRVIFS